MKPLAAIDVPDDADPAGRHEVVILPPSNTIALTKGGWQTVWTLLSGLLTLLVALWYEPSVAALILKVVKENPEWAIVFGLLNALFAVLKNRIAHKSPESRAAIVESVRGGLR